MNNKGFAITGIIYGLMLLFIVVVTSFLSILIGRNKRIDALLEGAYSSVEDDYIVVNYNSGDRYFYVENNKYTLAQDDTQTDIYITSKKAKYEFNINGSKCIIFLPSDVMIITNEIKKGGIVSGLYYYKLETENVFNDDLSEFKEIECINK